MTELERAAAFEEAMRDAGVERVVQTRFGPALFNDTYSIVWMLNVLRVETPGDASAEEIATEAERVQGASGIKHRRVLVTDPEAGRRLAPGFAGLGWKPDNFLFMVWRRKPEKLADTALVSEVRHDDLTQLRRAVNLEQLPDTTADELDQVMASSHLVEEPGRARHFAVVVEGQVVSATDLFSDGRTAQVEDVATLPEHRGRGYASAVVQRAVDEALADGHDFVFLTADADDWPKELYRKLGFEEVGSTWAFRKRLD
jgi:ribosomal protein S18 acetylase RimI-like enzyme